MKQLLSLIQGIESHIVLQQINNPVLNGESALVMLEPGLIPSDNVIYLGTQEEANSFLRNSKSPVTLFIHSGRPVWIEKPSSRHNVVITDLTLAQLYNHLSRRLSLVSDSELLTTILREAKPENISILLEELSFAPETNSRWMLITGSGLPSLRKDLLAIHSGWHTVQLGNSLWILGNLSNIDFSALSKQMEAYDSFACIGPPTVPASHLRLAASLTEYTLNLSMEQYHIAPTAAPQQAPRVFQFDNELFFILLRLGQTQLKEICGIGDLQCFLHPLVPTLCQYDAEHGTKLLNFLFLYLVTGENLTATASAMYMHRNTAQNWLKLIQKQGEVNLADGYERFRLFLSCLIMNYNWHSQPESLPQLRIQGYQPWIGQQG